MSTPTPPPLPFLHGPAGFSPTSMGAAIYRALDGITVGASRRAVVDAVVDVVTPWLSRAALMGRQDGLEAAAAITRAQQVPPVPCTSMDCDSPGVVPGVFDDGDTREWVTYCVACAEVLAHSGEFTPDSNTRTTMSDTDDPAVLALARTLGPAWDSPALDPQQRTAYRTSRIDRARDLLAVIDTARARTR